MKSPHQARPPSARRIAVIGGLITSTVFSLLVVPVVFTYLDDLEQFIVRMAGKLRGRKTPPPAPGADPEARGAPGLRLPPSGGGARSAAHLLQKE